MNHAFLFRNGLSCNKIRCNSHELRYAAFLDREEVQLPVVNRDSFRNVFHAADDGTVRYDEQKDFRIQANTICLNAEWKGMESRQLADSPDVVCHFAERIFKPHIHFMRNRSHHASTRYVDEIGIRDTSKICWTHLPCRNRIKVAIHIGLDAEKRRKVVRRSAPNDGKRQIKMPVQHEIDDFMYGTVSARNNESIRGKRTHEIDKSFVSSFARAIRDHEHVARLKGFDDPVEFILERRMAGNGIIKKHKLFQVLPPTPLAFPS